MIFKLCLFTLISLSTSTSLTLFAGAPTVPDLALSSYCCLPDGDITFTVLGQIYTGADDGWADDVIIQADEWQGPACTDFNITENSIVPGYSYNLTTLNAGNTFRLLLISIDGTDFWSTTLYPSSPNPLGTGMYVLFDLFSGLSILASLWLFYRYLKTARKSMSLHMILVLGIADFAYSLIALISGTMNGLTVLDSSNRFIVENAIDFVRWFAICWSTTMAIIFMKALSNNPLFRQFTLKIWVLCLLPSLILATCFLIIICENIALNYSVYFSTIIFAVPFFITIGCYIRTIIVFRKNPFGMKAKNRALFLYPSVQIFILLVSQMDGIVIVLSISWGTKVILHIILELFGQLAGFANGGVHLLQRKRNNVSDLPEDKSLNSADDSEL